MSFRLRTAAAVAALLAFAAVCATPPSVSAQEHSNQVEMQNKTQTAAVWVTVYKSSNFGKTSAIGAFCVPPRTTAMHTYYSTIYEVRAEITARADCTGTHLYDGLRGYPDGWNHFGHYFVTNSGTRYTFGNT